MRREERQFTTRPCPLGLCDGSGFVVDEERRRAVPCRCRPQRLARSRARRLSAVIPKRFQGVSFDRHPVTQMPADVVDEVRRYVRDIEENLDNGTGIWFRGDVGTGKTTLAMLISKAALDAGRSVAIYSLPRLLAELRMTYDEGSDTTYVDLLDRLSSVELLHIDDLGAEKTSPWVLEQLYAIINARYEDERALLLTTNLDKDGLEEQIGFRTVSRIFQMCGEPVELFGPDYRSDPQARYDATHRERSARDPGQDDAFDGASWGAGPVAGYGDPAFRLIPGGEPE